MRPYDGKRGTAPTLNNAPKKRSRACVVLRLADKYLPSFAPVVMLSCARHATLEARVVAVPPDQEALIAVP